MTVKVKATMLAIVTADLYVDNIGYNNTTLIEASEYARVHWTPELEAEASRAVSTFSKFDEKGFLSAFHMSDANILTFGDHDTQLLIKESYPLLDAYLEECFEAMANV
jgi:hypothetical protein